MIEHPWTELQVLIKEKWLTQKAFASILWKKVSEVNELLKWKRNITIQRDYLLHQTLWTPIKYWILKQVDYDYSLLDIKEESSVSTLDKDDLGEIWNSEQSEESVDDTSSYSTQWTIQENMESIDSSDHKWASEWEIEEQTISTQKSDKEADEDLQNRANIFRSF